MVFNDLVMRGTDLVDLLDLPSHDDEFTGFIFYGSGLVRGDPRDLAFGVALTGRGDSRTVHTPQRVLQRVVDAVASIPSMNVIEFHTHSVETVRRYGPVFATQLSSDDHDALRMHNGYFRGYSHLHVCPNAFARLYGVFNGVVRHVPARIESSSRGSPLEARLEQMRAHYCPELERRGIRIRDYANGPAAPPNLTVPAQPVSPAADGPISPSECGLRYAVAGGFFGFSYMAHSVAAKMYGTQKENLETAATAFCLIGLGLGLHTLYNHLRRTR